MLSVCIVIATYNAERTLGRCLESIFEQDYFGKGGKTPPVQVIIVDGGSTDKTLEIAKKFQVKIIVRKGLSSEGAKAVGLMAAKADVYCDMAADNYLPEKDFLRRHLSVLSSLSKDGVVAVYPERYYYDPKDGLLNRYFALLGVNDPLAYYLGKADRKSYLNSKFQVPNSNQNSNSNFQIVEFDENNMPTLGANGFFINRELLLRYADLKNFYHIDAVWDLLKSSKLQAPSSNEIPNSKFQKVRFAVVKTAIGHDTGENLGSFLKKRRRYFEDLYLKNIEKRRYHLYDPKRDFWKLVKFIFFSLTFIEPLCLSIKGFLKIRDRAWFLHPIICFLTVFNYGFSYYRHKK